MRHTGRTSGRSRLERIGKRNSGLERPTKEDDLDEVDKLFRDLEETEAAEVAAAASKKNDIQATAVVVALGGEDGV